MVVEFMKRGEERLGSEHGLLVVGVEINQKQRKTTATTQPGEEDVRCKALASLLT